MNTHCSKNSIEFNLHYNRKVTARFDGGELTSDGGGVLLREVEKHLNLFPRLAACFKDYRTSGKVEHTVEEMLKQRIYALALGHEDVNDHDTLRHDRMLALLSGKADISGAGRRCEADQGVPLASSSTLNRLELGHPDAASGHRYQRIVADMEAIGRLLVDLFIESHDSPPAEVWLDFDSTDFQAYGSQEGIGYNSYYGGHCYLPLYAFCGDQLLGAQLLSNGDDTIAVAVAELERMVGQLRSHWPQTKIVVRADAGFCRDDLMDWCERNGVCYLLGLSKNSRLCRRISKAQRRSQGRCVQTGEAARRYEQFMYRTLNSWTRGRQVIAKAECLPEPMPSERKVVRDGVEFVVRRKLFKDNQRFVVTNLPRSMTGSIRDIYEKQYCARGESENCIKQQKLDLRSDRTSCSKMRANQIRLYLAGFAYVLLDGLRRLALAGTEDERAYCSTIRNRYLKIAARLRVTARRVWLSLSESYPRRREFERAAMNMSLLPCRSPPV